MNTCSAGMILSPKRKVRGVDMEEVDLSAEEEAWSETVVGTDFIIFDYRFIILFILELIKKIVCK